MNEKKILIGNIVKVMENSGFYHLTDKKYYINSADFKPVAEKIQATKTLQDTEVIASGKVTKDLPQLDIWFINGKQINGYFKKYNGKNISISINNRKE